MAGRKIFVGSLPDGIDAESLQLEFSKYGIVEDVFVKPNCEPGRQWAFVTFQSQEQAQLAKDSCDRILTFPGAARACDVMLAKNQGMFGQEPLGGGQPDAPKKIFVGSLPDGIQESTLRAEFSGFGVIEEVFIKPGCEPGRQWAFVTFQRHDQAQAAAVATNNVLMFPGCVKTCEVTLARNQGMFGQGTLSSQHAGGQPQTVYPPTRGAITAAAPAPKKIFVGSLPDGIDDATLRLEFSKYGDVGEIFIKPGCEIGRQWAFVTFATPEQAQYAKDACDRVLMFPGGIKPCEVTLAKNQGMFGQEPLDGTGKGAGGRLQRQVPAAHVAYQGEVQQILSEGPKKVFVGSLPDNITEMHLRAEFSKYGHVIDVYIKPNCEPGRQWAFVTFATPAQAQSAKDATDRVLTFPGSAGPCEVMLAKNQGKFGQAPIQSFGHTAPQAIHVAPQHIMPVAVQPPVGHVVHMPATLAQPPPPAAVPPPPETPPPAHLTPWRMYKTVAGLPYYHNSVTGVTQWDCPPELQATPAAGIRYSPY